MLLSQILCIVVCLFAQMCSSQQNAVLCIFTNKSSCAAGVGDFAPKCQRNVTRGPSIGLHPPRVSLLVCRSSIRPSILQRLN
jgi:hypothetical protein